MWKKKKQKKNGEEKPNKKLLKTKNLKEFFYIQQLN